ncbi:MAG: ral nucleoside transport system ATP-binding protein [Candidatus Atribacteria bacterium]|nr:ral nucleoside transport system ATP-binding protein [Candidatus Atribacteria bacterium]
MLDAENSWEQKPVEVAFRSITKRFPPDILANDRVSFEVKKGTVHALLGENGAGKTTLMNIFYGLFSPDGGEIIIQGKPVKISSPREAINLGIGMVHQHFKLIPTHTVAENIILGLMSTSFFFPAEKSEAEIRALSEKYGLKVDPRARVWQLSAGEKQKVEILKALYRKASILILDEPTSVLTPQEAEELFATLRAMKEEGKTCIFITHKLNEVKEIADAVTVMRKGRVVSTILPSQVSLEELARMTVGKEVVSVVPRKTLSNRIVLQLQDVSAMGDRDFPALLNLSLSVREGEIVGVAGIAGNGQKELAEVIVGLREVTGGRIFLEDKEITNLLPRDIASLGVAYIPEERNLGLVGEMSVAENLLLRGYYQPPFSQGFWVDWEKAEAYSEKLISHYQINPPLSDIPVRLLSGGNRQRVIIARELEQKPKLVVASNPTAGLDVSGVEAIHKLLIQAQEKGAGILLISGDLDELLKLSNRIVIMFKGEIVGEKEKEHWTEEDRREIGLGMGGVKG